MFPAATLPAVRCLTDSPPVVRLKHEFAIVQDRMLLLKEWIDLRHGDVPAHYTELETLRQKKSELSQRIYELNGRKFTRLWPA